MIRGAHFLLHSGNPEADRAFFRDVLAFPCLDAGHGWLIFKLPAAEMAVHPADGGAAQADREGAIAPGVLYLMCDDLQQTLEQLRAHGIAAAPPQQAGWGVATSITLPSGARIGLYEPRHPLAIDL